MFGCLSENLLLTLKKNPYPINTILFNKSETGTFTQEIEQGIYELEICGAGGGGGGSATSHSWLGSNGGSGAAFKGIVSFTKGTLTIVVGEGGKGGSSSGRNAKAGSNGTASSISCGTTNLITTGAGNGGKGTGDYTNSNNGNGGTLTISNLTVLSSTIQSDGVAKSTTSILNNGYGCGGKASSSSSGTKGTNGYVKITYIGLKL